MKAADKRFLFDLLNTPSPTGFEVAGQRKWAAYVRKCADTVENDAYGNTWATLNGGGRGTRKRVMLYLDPDVYEALKAFAGKRKLSMNVAATLAVEAMLETEDA